MIVKGVRTKIKFKYPPIKNMEITSEFTPAANRNRKTLRVPTEAPADSIRCRMGHSYQNNILTL